MLKNIVLVVLLAAVSATFAAQIPDARLQQGTNAVAGQFPFMAALNIQNAAQSFCGAVIVNNQHLVTAASCILVNATRTLISPFQLSVLFGTHTNIFGAPVATVQSLYIHPQYNPYNFENDIAVIRVNQPFNFPVPSPTANLAPAVFNDRIVSDTAACQVVGWNTNVAQPVQQFLNSPIINRDTCNALAANLGMVSETKLCAGVLTAGPGVCGFNRGGGLFCNGQLTGILSHGLGCGTANQPGIYTQVRFHRQWIEQQFTRQDIPVAGVTPQPGL